MDGLATDLLKELKAESRRRFILLIICIVFLFGSNMAWLVAWNLPRVEEETSESYELQGEDNANVVYNSEGKVDLDVEYKGN